MIHILIAALIATAPCQRSGHRCADGRGRYGREGASASGSNCTTVTGTATNYALHSQELDDGVWRSFSLGAAAPTVTPNVAVAAPACADVFNLPGCGQLGVVDRVQFPATTIGQRSSIRQSVIIAEPIGKDTYVYAMAVGADCAIEIGAETSVDFWFTRTTVSSSWVRIADLGAAPSANPTIYIGNLGVATRPSATLGDVARAACDVYLWQVDLHAGGTESRPVKTTTVAASQGPGCY